ncbi:MAG TPA: AMP-binding protein [Candidatus Tectomicrobia bacterium]|nr:AMP-binding protein [Candidatus Tectomicrobia bacterium]
MDILAGHAERQPDRVALIEDDRHLTWRHFVEQRNRLARGLRALGVEPGEHLVLWAQNSLEYLLASAAARAAGALPVPMNHRLTLDEAAYILEDAEARTVVASEAFVPLAERLRERVPAVRRWIVVGNDRRPWATPLEALLATTDAAPLEPPAAPPGSMIYTAGTTGKPKGARRQVLDVAVNLPRFEALGCLDPAHVHLVAGPLYHSAPGGFATLALALGQTVVVMRKFDAEGALATIARHRCTTTFMAPTLLKRIVDLPEDVRRRYDVSSMRSIVVAAAPCPMRVKEEVLRHFGPVLYEFYGSTELGINTVLRPEDVLRKPHSCGRAAPGIELAILDEDGRPLPPGHPGELHVRRHPGAFDGYWNRPDATQETARGEWLTVGDVAWMDDEGFVYICDRKRDMIISGGVNIYPAEIEDVLHRHPAVDDAAVFGVPDDEWGERVHAAVRVRPGAPVTAADLIAFARQHLAGYKVPRDVSFHEDFPRDGAGKLVKRLLREPYWAGRATRV